MSATIQPLRPKDFAELERRVRSDGGELEDSACEPIRIDYKGPAPGGGSTCGCGFQRRVRIAYTGESGDRGDYVACANCDAVARQPRWRGQR